MEETVMALLTMYGIDSVKLCLNGGKSGQMAFQARADLQNQAIGWLQRGYSFLDGSTAARYPRIRMSSEECRMSTSW